MEVPIQIKDGSIKVVNLTRRKAIRERCRNCVGWKPSEARNCETTECPLHPYRSGNGKQNAKARGIAIREYCLWCCDKQRAEVYKCPAKYCPLFVFRKTQIDKAFKMDLKEKSDHIEAIFELN